jgi:hypothetical protein
MTIKVPVGDIIEPRHLAAFVYTDPDMSSKARMEVYTGWVPFRFSDRGGIVDREEVMCFVPHYDRRVQSYDRDTGVLGLTVTAAPSSIVDDEGEANVAAVDVAHVYLEPQRFLGVAGVYYCLVLRVRVAALFANIQGIAYQVTVLAKIDGNQPLIRLEPDATPQAG